MDSSPKLSSVTFLHGQNKGENGWAWQLNNLVSMGDLVILFSPTNNYKMKLICITVFMDLPKSTVRPCVSYSGLKWAPVCEPSATPVALALNSVMLMTFKSIRDIQNFQLNPDP